MTREATVVLSTRPRSVFGLLAALMSIHRPMVLRHTTPEDVLSDVAHDIEAIRQRLTQMSDPSDEQWLAAFSAAQENNRRQFKLAVIYAATDFFFAVLALAGAVYLIYNGRALGVFLAFVGANFANVRRLASIARNWLDQAEPD